MKKYLCSLTGALLLACSLRAQPLPIRPVPVEVSDIKLYNGLRLQYIEQGDPSGIPVILLHGFTDSWHSWELLLPELPFKWHVYALTLRGHGESDRPFEGYDPKDFAADVVAFMDEKHLPQAIIVGHSMGSIIAQKLAIDHPDRTSAIVLAGTFAGFADNVGIQRFQQQLDTLNDPIDETFAQAFQQSTLANPVPDEFFQTLVMESRKVPSRVWKSTAAALFKVNYLPALKAYGKPALIIWGDKDVFCPREDQDELVLAMKEARLLVYGGTGHALHWEEPVRFAEDLTAFVQKVTDQ